MIAIRKMIVITVHLFMIILVIIDSLHNFYPELVVIYLIKIDEQWEFLLF